MALLNTAWSFSVIVVPDFPLRASISSSAIKLIREMGQQELSTPAWSFAALEVHDRPLLQSLASQSIPILEQCHCATGVR